jgi:uncharacterized membrane protein YfcA
LLALGAGLLIAAVTTPVGVSGAVFLLPVQLSVLHVPSPAVTPTNLLSNVVAGPGALLRYRSKGSLGGRLTRLLLTGTLPGVVLGAVVRVFAVPGPRVFRLIVAVVLLPLGHWLSVKALQPAVPATAARPLPDRAVIALGVTAGTIGGIYGVGGPRAVQAGFRSVHAFPLRVRRQVIMALNVTEGTPASPFTYNLSLSGTGTVPSGTRTFRATDLATVKQRVRRQASQEVRALVNFPATGFSTPAEAIVELGTLAARSDYFSTVTGTSFGTFFLSGSRAADGSIDADTSAAGEEREYRKGAVITEPPWNSAVFGPAFDPPDGGIAERDETTMNVSLPLLQGTGGHDGDNMGYTGYTRLTRNGKVLWSGKEAGDADSANGGVPVPAETGTYRLTTGLDRTAPWARLSRHVEVDWAFISKPTDDGLPLQVVE